MLTTVSFRDAHKAPIKKTKIKPNFCDLGRFRAVICGIGITKMAASVIMSHAAWTYQNQRLLIPKGT